MSTAARGAGTPTAGATTERHLPPVIPLGIATLALVVTGGIYLAAHVHSSATLTPAVVLAALAGLLMLWNLVTLVRLTPFAWGSFFLVAKWAFLAYLVIAGMLEYVFVLDHTPARQLLLLTVMLALFAVTVPMILAFSVARFQPVTDGEAPG